MQHQAIDYALGYHEQWMVVIHELEAEFQEAGKELSAKDRAQYIDAFIVANPRSYNTILPCPVCQTDIANALLENRDPFEPTGEARSKLVQNGVDVDRMVANRKRSQRRKRP